MTLPLALEVRGRRVVVVGGGPVAAAKISSLRDAGADVIVIAPEAAPEVVEAATLWHRRPYAGPDDLDQAWLVVAATGDAATDDAVVRAAEERMTWCVRSGRPADGVQGQGSAAFMAAVRRDGLVLAVSSGAPGLSRFVRQELEARFGREYGQLATLLAELRQEPAVRAHLESLSDSQRKTVWRSLPLVHILGLLREGAFDAATELAFSCLSSSSD